MEALDPEAFEKEEEELERLMLAEEKRTAKATMHMFAKNFNNVIAHDGIVSPKPRVTAALKTDFIAKPKSNPAVSPQK